ncbi:LamG domain-containing protein [Couchioplanes caeruleus]|nr:LamG-like jellyroll fold domain-containing protein [Couchioplanes caeruleus]
MAAAVLVPAEASGAALRTVPQAEPGTEALDEGSALRRAAATGDRVEVAGERTEYSQLFAEPDGRLTFESTVEPKRVRRADGSWQDADLTLTSDGGSVRPRSSVADVRFSDGGAGPLATMVKEGKTFTIGWSGGDLPEPKLDGDSATYGEVLPGVDLVVRATPLGFTHVLTVKSAAAAANPAVREVRFDLGGDAQVVRSPDGGLTAVAGDTLVARADGPAMWDSRKQSLPKAAGTRAANKSEVAGGGGEQTPSTPAGPGDTARVAPVTTEITPAGDLVLKPDPALLSPSSTYPVFIDPPWSKSKARWAYATNNNSSNTDVSRANVGRNPSGGILYRSFFEFPTTTLKDKHIESAYVKMKLDHSWSCTPTATHMYHAGALSATPRTKWSTSLIKRVAVAESHANEAGGCHDSPQQDMPINFTGSDVTTMLRQIAAKGTSAVTVGFSARNPAGEYESAQDRWKRWYPGEAKLIADIDARPGPPHSMQVSGVACNASSDIRVGVTNPSFSAVFPDADKGQPIKGTWEWIEQRPDGSWFDKTPPPPTSTAAGTRTSTAPVTGAADGRRYRVRVKATDPAPYGLYSYSPPCTFVVDTKVPPVTVTELERPAGPGKPGRYKITSTATDVSSLRYGWTEAVTSTATPVTEPGVAGKSATVTVTAPKYGVNTLYAQAIDATKNTGYASHEFTVARPSPPVARWSLETNPKVTQTAALADGQPTLAGNTPLTGTGVTWNDNARLVDAPAATFTGAGSLSTQIPVVDTTKSFAVATWARLEQTSSHQTLISQEGTHSARFQLVFRTDDRNGDGTKDLSWCFGARPADVDNADFAAAACAVNTAVAGRWTHVAGAYDAPTNKLQAWVDGTLKAETDAPPAWNATGPLRLGARRVTTTQLSDHLRGNLADVHIYDRALVPHDFTGQLATDEDSSGINEPGILQPTEVGRWNFDTATSCPNEPAEPDSCEAPDAAAWNRRLRLTYGTAVDTAGHRGYGGLFNSTHYAEDPDSPNHGAKVRAYGHSQVATAPGGQQVWADSPVLRTDQSFSVSAWVQIDNATSVMTAVAQKGTNQSAFYLGARKSTVDGVTGLRFEAMTTSADTTASETYTHVIAPDLLTIDDTPDWTHLTFVYDSGAKQQRLYINGALKKTANVTGSWHANGPLLVGNSYYTDNAGSGGYTDQWLGGIDDVSVYQGALTSAQVRNLHDDQAVAES